MAYREPVRRRLRLGALLLVALGLLSAGYGTLASRDRPVPDPVRLGAGEELALPRRAGPGAEVALYGTRRGTDAAPTATELGCRTRAPDGDGPRLSVTAAGRLDRRVVDGDAVLPLLAVQGDIAAGATIRCTGTEALASQPLYLVGTAGVRDMVPMAAWSLAVLSLALGIAGVLTLRPEDRPPGNPPFNARATARGSSPAGREPRRASSAGSGRRSRRRR